MLISVACGVGVTYVNTYTRTNNQTLLPSFTSLQLPLSLVKMTFAVYS